MKKSPGFPRLAFTLIELLVVMGIIVLMGALVVPAVSGTLKGTALNQAAQTLQGQFNNAQQVALAKGVPIEMRLIMCADPDSATASKDDTTLFRVRGMQLYSILPNQDPTTPDIKLRYTPVSKLEFLPNTIIINSGKTLSTLCDKSNTSLFRDEVQTEDYLHPKLQRIGLHYRYYRILFRPDGRTDLDPNGSWFLTMHDLNKGDDQLIVPPSNFFTLLLDPVQGSTRAFRPM